MNIEYVLTDLDNNVIDTTHKQTKLMQNIIYRAKRSGWVVKLTTDDEYGKLTSIRYRTIHYRLTKFIEYEK